MIQGLRFARPWLPSTTPPALIVDETQAAQARLLLSQHRLRRFMFAEPTTPQAPIFAETAGASLIQMPAGFRR